MHFLKLIFLTFYVLILNDLPDNFSVAQLILFCLQKKQKILYY
jgi:hypothetical protein